MSDAMEEQWKMGLPVIFLGAMVVSLIRKRLTLFPITP